MLPLLSAPHALHMLSLVVRHFFVRPFVRRKPLYQLWYFAGYYNIHGCALRRAIGPYVHAGGGSPSRTRYSTLCSPPACNESDCVRVRPPLRTGTAPQLAPQVHAGWVLWAWKSCVAQRVGACAFCQVCEYAKKARQLHINSCHNIYYATVVVYPLAA